MDNNYSLDSILVVQGAEYRAVQQGIKQANLTAKLDKIPQIIPIPIGEKDAQTIWENTEFLDNSQPQNVLIMGLCGSLSPEESVGDIVLYRACIKGNLSLATDKALTAAIQQQLNSNISLVTALTCDRVIHSTTEKQTLAETYPATVVDMEGFAYLQTLQSQGIAVAILRVVSDDIHGNLPDLNQAINDDGKIETIPLIISLLRQPLAAVKLIKGSLKGLQILKQVTRKLLE
ncbi:MAG: hypothetical protein AB4372_20395 [Xenococcus sp. (in: cyanobacteria)]